MVDLKQKQKTWDEMALKLLCGNPGEWAKKDVVGLLLQ